MRVILFISLLLGISLAFAQAPDHQPHGTPHHNQAPHEAQGCSLQLDGNSRLFVDRFGEGKRAFKNNSVQFSLEHGSIEVWIMPSSSYVHERGVVLQTGIIPTSSMSAVSYAISYNFTAGYVQADFWTLTDLVWSVNSQVAPLANEQWAHVSLDLFHQLLRVNGSTGIAAQDTNTQQAPEHRFFVGTNFTGLVDEIRVWKKAPGGSVERVHCFEAQTDNLVLLLSFDECGGDAVADHSESNACASVGPATRQSYKKGTDHNNDRDHDDDHHNNGYNKYKYGGKHGNDRDDDDDDNDRNKDHDDDRHDDDHDNDNDRDKDHDDDRRENDEGRHKYNKHGRNYHRGGKGHHGSHKRPFPFRLTNTTSTWEFVRNYFQQHGKPSWREHGKHGHHHEVTAIAYGSPAPKSHYSCFLETKMPNVTAQCPYRNHGHGKYGNHQNGSHGFTCGGIRDLTVMHALFLFALFTSCFCCVRCCRRRMMKRRMMANEKRGFVSLHPAKNVAVNSSEEAGGYYYYPGGVVLDQPGLYEQYYPAQAQENDDAPLLQPPQYQPQAWEPTTMGGYMYYMPQTQMPPMLQEGRE